MSCRPRRWCNVRPRLAGRVLAGRVLAGGMLAGGLLAGAPAQALCTGLGTTPAGNTVAASVTFSSTASTTGSFVPAQGTIAGTGCAGNSLLATPSNSSTSGAGQARLGVSGPTLNYQLRDASNAAWGNQNSNKLSVSGASFSVQFSVADRSNSGFLQAGTYTDTVQVALAQGNTPTGDSFTLLVSIKVQEHCVLTGIGAVTLAYTSFAPTVSADMTFSAACNASYSIALDEPTTGTLLGLNYSLSLTPSGTGLAGSTAGNAHTVRGTIQGPQGGQCNASSTVKCTGTNTHQMTVTY